MSLPKTIGLFRLTRDAELRYTADGKPILKMGLAASEKFGEKESQCFLDATVFGKMAETINQYAGEKGTQIFLTGKLQTETWVDKESGQNRSKQSMIVESFDFVAGVNSKKETGVNAPVHNEPRPTPYNKPQPVRMPENNLPDIDIDEESIPF